MAKNQFNPKKTSIISSLIQNTPLNPGSSNSNETDEKELNNNNDDIDNTAENSNKSNDKTNITISKSSKKNTKKDFIDEILENVSFETRKAKYVTNDMSDKLSMLSSLTGYSEQVIIHSILQDFFKRNESNIKVLLKDFLK